jgi:hypothetical protein
VVILLPVIREKAPRERNANVNLKLTLSEDEATMLKAAFPKAERLSEAMTALAMREINAFFKAKK